MVSLRFRLPLFILLLTHASTRMVWLNLGLLGLLTLGNATLWIGLVNRTHALPWRHRTLKRIRHVHDLALLVFPIAVLWCVGLTGPKLLRGGSWRHLGVFWTVIFSICALGVLWLLWIILRRGIRNAPNVQLSNHSEMHDIAAELKKRPVSKGPYFALTRVPGNEQFQLEVSEKHFCLPGLPNAWDELSILHLSDFHFLGTITLDYYQRVMKLAAEMPVDMVCFTGDLIDEPQCLSWLPDTLGQLSAPLGQFFILGNHDWNQDAEAIRTAISQLGWSDVGRQGTLVEYRGMRLGIAGDETPWIGQHPEIPDHVDFKLLLSHTPDNYRWAQQAGFDIVLSGHNHGGQVKLPVIGPIYAPSLYGCRYAEGSFWEEGTLLHVSRGLAGQHPLRLNCLPEITRLVLHRSTDEETGREETGSEETGRSF